MSRGKKDREEITNTEEVKETEVSDEMEKAENSEKSEDDKKLEETKETDDKPVSLYVQEPFIDPSVYRQRRKKRIIRIGFRLHQNHFQLCCSIDVDRLQ